MLSGGIAPGGRAGSRKASVWAAFRGHIGLFFPLPRQRADRMQRAAGDAAGGDLLPPPARLRLVVDASPTLGVDSLAQGHARRFLHGGAARTPDQFRGSHSVTPQSECGVSATMSMRCRPGPTPITSTGTSRHCGGLWGAVRRGHLLPPRQMRGALRTGHPQDGPDGGEQEPDPRPDHGSADGGHSALALNLARASAC